MENNRTYTVFASDRLVVSGALKTILLQTKEYLDRSGADPVLIFDDQTGKQVDFDFRGSPEDVLSRLATHPLFAKSGEEGKPRTGPGRPKLGVVCREVSLLPRHWEWLEQQPNGISAALRRLVEEARKHEPGKQRASLARDAASRFMSAMAGNLPGFEEALRALYARDQDRLMELVRDWPPDIRNHTEQMVQESERLEREPGNCD
jgi:uncharacterized protein